MGLLSKLKSLFGIKSKPTRKPIPKNACYFCKSKGKGLRKYYNESNAKIKVCSQCVEYAERRAFRK